LRLVSDTLPVFLNTRIRYCRTRWVRN